LVRLSGVVYIVPFLADDVDATTLALAWADCATIICVFLCFFVFFLQNTSPPFLFIKTKKTSPENRKAKQ